jgi:hypothetical protein
VEGDADVYASGRWGEEAGARPECWAFIRAEDAYTLLLREGTRVGPGWRGELSVTFPRAITHQFTVRIVPNAVWRNGRVFLVCPWCARQCKRLNLPLPTACLRCAAVLGLTSSSRQRRNYKDAEPAVVLRRPLELPGNGVRRNDQRTAAKN